MARRHSAASRSSSSSSRSSTGRSSRSGGRVRSDGKVDIACPQCGAAYRVGEDMLDEKIECSDCHRVFFAKSTAGKRITPPDYTKVYIGFGIAIITIIAIFMAMSSSGNEVTKRKKVYVPAPIGPSVGTHARTMMMIKWAQSISDNHQLTLESHSDVPALTAQLGAEGSDLAALVKALQEHESARFLRDMQCDSGELSSHDDMTSATGSGILFVVPKPPNDDYKKNTRGTIGVTFRMDGEQVKITSWKTVQVPVWNPTKPPPGTVYINVNKDIERPDEMTITDSAGTRKVQESKPTAVPHWGKATPEQRTMADQVTADIIRSADHNSPATLFNRATMKIMSSEDKQACVPRVLNAMFERYNDVQKNNMELSQLNRALCGWTGYAVNYQVRDDGDPARAIKERQSCVRQWFAFWWRYHEDLSDFFDTGDDLELDPVSPKAGDPNKKK